jgi:hypothetical protein
MVFTCLALTGAVRHTYCWSISRILFEMANTMRLSLLVVVALAAGT